MVRCTHTNAHAHTPSKVIPPIERTKKAEAGGPASLPSPPGPRSIVASGQGLAGGHLRQLRGK